MIDVTVITATIPGREDFLKECKESVCKQNAPPKEHLVLLDKDRRGESWVRNQLLEKVSTEWVCFLDDDDYFLPEHLETLWSHREGYNFVYSWCEQWQNKWNAGELKGRNYIPICAPIIKTELVRSAGCFDESDNKAEDWKLWKKLFDVGLVARHVPKITFVIRPHGSR